MRSRDTLEGVSALIRLAGAVAAVVVLALTFEPTAVRAVSNYNCHESSGDACLGGGFTNEDYFCEFGACATCVWSPSDLCGACGTQAPGYMLWESNCN